MELFLYIDKRSFIHRLDPRTKIVGAIGFFALALVFNHPLYVFILLCIPIILSSISFTLGNIYRMRVLLTLLFFFSSVLWPIFLRLSREAILYGIAMGLRLDMMTITGILFLSTTRQEELSFGLHKLGIPYRIGFALSMATRLVPVFLGTGSTVIEAQKSRGLDLDTGNIFVRIKKHIPLIIPIFVSAIKNTDKLAMALESKGFGSDSPRTYYIESRLDVRDYAFLFFIVLLLTFCIYLRLKGYG
ncbi:MAG TPA: energy-coupling factor transporter transmembrane protein EcfT, partial [bacterium (Candidatus Stahlbacteria)]|nr:energy-coupling factor transporter transmembrane protein EcfT [Candidatus Stahlbacteria bacterium]